jgi:hypothetical protein
MAEEQIVWLSRLAEAGVQMAEAAGRRALAEAEAPEPAADQGHADPNQAYAKVARSVRLTVALRSRALKDWVALEQAGAEAWAACEAAAAKARAAVGRQRLQRHFRQRHGTHPQPCPSPVEGEGF